MIALPTGGPPVWGLGIALATCSLLLDRSDAKRGMRRQCAQVEMLVFLIEHAPRDVTLAEIDERRRHGRTLRKRVPAPRSKRTAGRQPQQVRRLAFDGHETFTAALIKPRQRLQQ